jgi:hypothetical protein
MNSRQQVWQRQYRDPSQSNVVLRLISSSSEEVVARLVPNTVNRGRMYFRSSNKLHSGRFTLLATALRRFSAIKLGGLFSVRLSKDV